MRWVKHLTVLLIKQKTYICLTDFFYSNNMQNIKTQKKKIKTQKKIKTHLLPNIITRRCKKFHKYRNSTMINHHFCVFRCP
ncbi:hypothetical protein Hanom_Chr10g00919081 [Helianthus anomalus]